VELGPIAIDRLDTSTDEQTILLVEDNPADASLVREMLSDASPRLALTYASTLHEAKETIARNAPAVVLADLGLPDAVGIETLEQLLAVTPPDVPVVVLTGDGDHELGHAAIAAGAHDFLKKSEIAGGQLRRCLRYALSSRLAVQALRDTASPLRSVFGTAVAQAFVSRCGDVLEVNAGFEQMTGYRREDVVNAPLLDLVAVGDRARVKSALATCVPVEAAMICRDSRHVHVRFHVAPLRAFDGVNDAAVVLFQDLTEQRTAEERARFQAVLLDLVGDAVIAADAHGRVSYVNAAAQRLYHVDAYGLLGERLQRVVGLPPDQKLPDGSLASSQAPLRFAAPLQLPGRRADVVTTITPTVNEAGAVEGWSAVVMDITEIVVAERALSASQRRFSSLVEQLSEMVSVHARDGRVLFVTGGVERLLGKVPSTPDILSLVHPDDAQALNDAFQAWLRGVRRSVAFRVRTANHEWRSCESIGVNLIDVEHVRGVVVTTRDVTDRVAVEQQLAHGAMHDDLTGLPKRTLFLDRLANALARMRRTSEGVAVLFLDLDHFRLVNDSLGHEAGDELLLAVTGATTSVMRPGDTVARVVGDEFVVCCEGIRDVEEATGIAHRIRAALSDPFELSAGVANVTASIGVAFVSAPHAADAAATLRDAEAALYQAKDEGRDRVAVFDAALHERSRRRVLVRDELRVAVNSEQLSVHYQPQVQLSTGALVGVEALVRWHHRTLGEIGPAEFISVAEETGLILPMGRFVLKTACEQLAEWRERHPDLPLTMSVNLSARQLADATLASFLRDVLERTGIDPSALCLEITESVIMERAAESDTRLKELKACGVQLAIDDFGTGYSSLAYLKRFPLDQLKIDREFVAGLGTNPEDTIIVASVIRLATSLGLEVLAEGVEREDQRDELLALGCDRGQGFLWSTALPHDALARLLDGSKRCWAPAAVRDALLADAPDTEALLSVDDVVSVLRHELATPMTVIKGYTEILQARYEGEARQFSHALEAIHRSTDGVQSLLLTLNDLRSVGSGSLSLTLAPVDVARLVSDVIDDLASLLENHDVSLEADRVAVVTADAARLRQVVMNLLSNAAKFSPPGSRLDVSVRAREAEVTVAVTDEGPGVPVTQVGRLFRKFSRLDRRQPGTGLGLFLSRGIARAHGGDVTYRTAPGGGAEFLLRLPVNAPLSNVATDTLVSAR
jgi:diguanylate cyclase (GGDEF)-like protein/PAS domain S-box-containing protein